MSININIEKLKKDITSEDILASLFYYAVFGEKISEIDLEQIIAYDTYDKIKTMGSFIIIDRVTNNTVGAGMIRNKSLDQTKKQTNYSEFEVEFNALVRKHFPHWEAKEIF